MVLTRSRSQYIPRPDRDGWGDALASEIDAAIHTLGADRDVIDVSVMPIVVPAGGPAGGAQTAGVIVTVVWRQPRT